MANTKRANAKKTAGTGSRYSKGERNGNSLNLKDKIARKTQSVAAKLEEKKVDDSLIFGRNAVMEVLKGTKSVEYIYTTEGDKEGSINKILGIARDKNIIIKYVDRKKLDLITNKGSHQGIVAKITDYVYCEVSDILNVAKERGEKPFVIILDEIEDPHNLGSIIRTAELTGAHGIIIPKRRAVGVTATVYKTSAGAVENMKVSRVTNLAAEVENLKKAGIFVYGADMDGEEKVFEADFSGPCALIIGNEGKGISNILKDKCDKIVTIPMVGKLNSLNASVAGGILMYEVMKGRLEKK